MPTFTHSVEELRRAERATRLSVEGFDSFGRIGGDLRGALVDRFPYVVVFTVDVSCVRRDWRKISSPEAMAADESGAR